MFTAMAVPRLTRTALCVLALTSAAAGDAKAGTPKEDAAALGDRGLSEYGAGKLVEALLLFQQAHSTSPSVTFQLYEARCLVRLGRVAEAERLYDQVAQTPVDERASPVVLDAVAMAEREREALRAGKAPAAERPSASGPSPLMLRPDDAVVVRSLRTAGWVGVGVGAVGVLTGIGFGLSAASKRSDLDDRCRGSLCNPANQGAVEDFRSAKTTSTVAWVVGSAFLGAGAGVLLLIPAPRAPRHAWFRPVVVAPLAAGISGAF